MCPEYFTDFKFIQFRLSPQPGESERLLAALVGFFATWWVGILIALLLGAVGIQSLEWKAFLKLKIRAITITFVVTVILGIVGYIIGLIGSNALGNDKLHVFHLAGYPEMYEALLQVKDIKGFVTVGYIHTFSYLGGFAGMVIAMFYQFRQVKFLRNTLKKAFDVIKEDDVD
ncbi:MAG: hypothetical protein ACI837_002470 [Crocinitomicaceae bacterium]